MFKTKHILTAIISAVAMFTAILISVGCFDSVSKIINADDAVPFFGMLMIVFPLVFVPFANRLAAGKNENIVKRKITVISLLIFFGLSIALLVLMQTRTITINDPLDLAVVIICAAWYTFCLIAIAAFYFFQHKSQ